MLAALEVLAGQAGGRRQVAVLGNMLELGPASEAAHYDVGEAAARNTGLSLLITVGDRARGIAQAARENGMSADQVVPCPDNDTALAVLERRLCSGDLVLIKGSRGVTMETVVQGLMRVATCDQRGAGSNTRTPEHLIA
jgi:UDP-N-acetylmuramoyl-tripeptide--D-alanyl-D-alanine ligase